MADKIRLLLGAEPLCKVAPDSDWALGRCDFLLSHLAGAQLQFSKQGDRIERKTDDIIDKLCHLSYL